MTKLKNLNGDKTQNLNMGKNSSCDKTQIVTKPKLWEKNKLKKMTKLKLWQNLKTQIMTKHNTSNCDKTQKLNFFLQNLKYDKSQFMKKKNFKGSVSKNIMTPWQSMRCSLGSVLQCFYKCYDKEH